MEFTLTHPDGSTLALNSRANQCAVITAKQSKALLSDDTITIEVLSATPLPLQIGDKLTAVGSTYTLNQLPAAKKTAADEYKYTIILEGLQYALIDRVFMLPDGTRGDDLMTDLEGALKVLIENANRNNGGKPYALTFCPEGSKTQNINYAGSNCLRALQQMCEDWDVEFKLTETDTAINLSIITDTPPFSIPFSVGRKGGVYELNRNKPSEDIVTRLYAYGGTENLTYYRHTRLCLPGKERKQSYIEDTAAVNTYGLRESVKNFDDIIPQREGKVTKLGGSYKSFVDSTIDFDLNEKWASTEAQCLEWIALRGIENTEANRAIYYADVAGKSTRYLIDGQTAQVHFQSGALAGYDIDIESYDHATKTLKLIPLVDNNQYSFPSQTSSAFQFAVGDKYIFVGINLPESYKTAAEAKLLESAQEFYSQHCKPRASYTLSIAPLWLQRMAGGGDESAVYNVFDVGDLIHVDDEALGISADIRIQSFERDLLNPYDYKLTISDTTDVKTLARVVGDVSTITRVVDTSGIADPNRQRRSWLTAQEVLNRTFDTEGHYYSDKIAPLSIETQMLAVGARSQQFTLANVLFIPNALNGSTADPKKLMATAGQLIHYTIDPGGVKVWTMSALSVTGLATTALYVYAKCARDGDGGVFVVDGVQRVFDADPSYYFFLIGTLSSVDAKYNTRTLSLTYGSTTINGRYIKTGRISSNDGRTYFDLDTGKINGKITFTNSAGDAEDLTDALSGIQSTADAAKNAAENIKVGGRNYITSTSSNTKWTCTDGVWYCGEITSDYWEYSKSQHRGISLASGDYVLTVWLLDTTEEKYNGMFVYKSDGMAIVGSGNLASKFCKAGKYQWKFTLAEAAEIGIQIKNRGRYRIQLEEGTLGTDWTPAPEDVDGAISDVDTKAQQGIDNAAAADMKAGNAQNTANTANTAAGKAADAAKNAQAKADTAEANAQKGITAAGKAQTTADNAASSATAAKSAADKAQEAADAAQVAADNAAIYAKAALSGNIWQDQYFNQVKYSILYTGTDYTPPVGKALLCAGRDHHLGEFLCVQPGRIYRQRITALRILGSRTLQGGFWYQSNATTKWHNPTFTAIEAVGSNGWQRYECRITIPPAESAIYGTVYAARMMLQINQSATGGDTQWLVSDLIWEDVTAAENNYLTDNFKKNGLTTVEGGVTLGNFIGVRKIGGSFAVAGMSAPKTTEDGETVTDSTAFFAGAPAAGEWKNAAFNVDYDGVVRMSKAEISSASASGGELLLGDGKISVTNGSKVSRFTCDNHGTIASAFPESVTTNGTFTALDYTKEHNTIITALSESECVIEDTIISATRTITGFPSGALTIPKRDFTVSLAMSASASWVKFAAWSCSVTVSYKLTLNGTAIQTTKEVVTTMSGNGSLTPPIVTGSVKHEVPKISKEIGGGTLVETFSVELSGTVTAQNKVPTKIGGVVSAITISRTAISAKVVTSSYFNKYFSNGMLQNAADQRYLAYLCGATDGLDLRQRCGKYGFDVVLDKGMLLTRYDSATPTRYRMSPIIFVGACVYTSSGSKYTVSTKYNPLGLTFAENATRNGTGDITITHNIGNTNYVPLAMGSGTAPRYVTMRTKEAKSIRFLLSDDDSTNDGDFFFYIFDYSTL